MINNKADDNSNQIKNALVQCQLSARRGYKIASDNIARD